jgi:HAD superfamily hydrolase (TIGR01509 family)
MRLHALIFDVDGTLADTEEQHRLAFNSAFERAGLPWRWDRPAYRALLRTPGGKERITSFIDGLSLPQDEKSKLLERVPEIHREKTKLFTAAVRAREIAARPGVDRLISEARAAGVRLAIATTTSPENVDVLLDALGWKSAAAFEVIACGDEVAKKKPAPDVYELALRRLEVAPEHAVAFEDSAPGLRAATAAGLWTVVTPTFWTEGEDFGAAGLVRDTLHGLGLRELTALRCA